MKSETGNRKEAFSLVELAFVLFVASILLFTAGSLVAQMTVRVDNATKVISEPTNSVFWASNAAGITNAIGGNFAPASGSTNISTLGTITNGVWHGSPVGISYGGTGATNPSTARGNLGIYFDAAGTKYLSTSAATTFGQFSGRRMIRFAYYGDSGGYVRNTFAFESADGVNFAPLNGGSPVLVDPAGEATCVSVFRWHGQWAAVYIGGTVGNIDGFRLAFSDDLITWTGHRTVTTGISGRPNVWSPAAFVDSDGSLYVFFTAVNNDRSAQSNYYIKATNLALTTWTSPTAMLPLLVGDYGSAVQRDPFITKSGDDYIYLWGGAGGIKYAVGKTVTGPFIVGSGSTDGEAPFLVKTQSGWRLYFDYSETGSGDRYCDLSADLKTGWLAWAASTPITPANYHHPSFIFLDNTSDFSAQAVGQTAVIPAVQDRNKVSVFDDFIGGTTTTGVGLLQWRVAGTGAAAGTNYALLDGRPGLLKISTTSSAEYVAYTDTAGARPFSEGGDFVLEIGAKVGNLTNVKYAFGLTEGGTTVATAKGIYVLFDPAISSNFLVRSKGSGDEVVIDTGVAADSLWHTFRIRSINARLAVSVANASGVFSADVFGASAASMGEAAIGEFLINATESAEKSITVDFFSLSQFLVR